jgi:hypothetical protein
MAVASYLASALPNLFWKEGSPSMKLKKYIYTMTRKKRRGTCLLYWSGRPEGSS